MQSMTASALILALENKQGLLGFQFTTKSRLWIWLGALPQKW